MKKSLIIGLALISTAGSVAFAQNLGAIKERQTIMDGWIEAGKPIYAQLRGRAPFNLAESQTFLTRVIAGAPKMKDLYPDDSKEGGKTAALPGIWDDKPKFLAGYVKIEADAKAALLLIKDEASFKAEMPKVTASCGGCHKVYQKPE